MLDSEISIQFSKKHVKSDRCVQAKVNVTMRFEYIIVRLNETVKPFII